MDEPGSNGLPVGEVPVQAWSGKMTGTPLLTRRELVAAGCALAAGRATAAPEAQRRITLGQTTFAVPGPFLFGDIMPLDATVDGLPPSFSFAFLAPGGAPAGEGLQFPPTDQPFDLKRENGQFLVMCYRVTSCAPGSPLGTPGIAPEDQLAHAIMPTEKYVYSNEDGMLVIRSAPTDLVEQRYASIVDWKNSSGVRAFFTHPAGDRFHHGTLQLYACNVRTVMYISQEEKGKISAALLKASELLESWKIS